MDRVVRERRFPTRCLADGVTAYHMDSGGGLGDEPKSGPAGCQVPLKCFVGFAQLAGRERSRLDTWI